MNAKIFYTNNINPEQIEEVINALIKHLCPEQTGDFGATIALERAMQYLERFKLDRTGNNELNIPMAYHSTAKMAEILGIYPGHTTESYEPTPVNLPGNTGMFKVSMYPLSAENRYVSPTNLVNNFGFRLLCSPDYRSHIYMSPKDENIVAIQSLRFGWDFFVRPLESYIGKPELVMIGEGREIEQTTVEKLLKPELTMDERLAILR
jgi:hypothetical protein